MFRVIWFPCNPPQDVLRHIIRLEAELLDRPLRERPLLLHVHVKFPVFRFDTVCNTVTVL